MKKLITLINHIKSYYLSQKTSVYLIIIHVIYTSKHCWTKILFDLYTIWYKTLKLVNISILFFFLKCTAFMYCTCKWSLNHFQDSRRLFILPSITQYICITILVKSEYSQYYQFIGTIAKQYTKQRIYTRYLYKHLENILHYSQVSIYIIYIKRKYLFFMHCTLSYIRRVFSC